MYHLIAGRIYFEIEENHYRIYYSVKEHYYFIKSTYYANLLHLYACSRPCVGSSKKYGTILPSSYRMHFVLRNKSSH